MLLLYENSSIFVPNLVFSLVAGVIADRMPRRTLILTTQITFMLLAVILTLLSSAGILTYWHILILSVYYEVLCQ